MRVGVGIIVKTMIEIIVCSSGHYKTFLSSCPMISDSKREITLNFLLILFSSDMSSTRYRDRAS